jgi:peptide/nickel transport system permease protein
MLLRRLVHLLVVLFFVTLFVALLTSMLPGDPVDAIAGFASPEQKDALREDLGLDDPLPVQYARWIGDFVTGDLGG